jgi:hypothetical protein
VLDAMEADLLAAGPEQKLPGLGSLIRSLFQAGEIDRAEGAIRRNPVRAKAAEYAGIEASSLAYYRSPAEAIAWAEKLAGADFYVHRTLATTLWKMGKKPEATAEFRKAGSLLKTVSSAEARNSLAVSLKLQIESVEFDPPSFFYSDAAANSVESRERELDFPYTIGGIIRENRALPAQLTASMAPVLEKALSELLAGRNQAFLDFVQTVSPAQNVAFVLGTVVHLLTGQNRLNEGYLFAQRMPDGAPELLISKAEVFAYLAAAYQRRGDTANASQSLNVAELAIERAMLIPGEKAVIYSSLAERLSAGRSPALVADWFRKAMEAAELAPLPKPQSKKTASRPRFNPPQATDRISVFEKIFQAQLATRDFEGAAVSGMRILVMDARAEGYSILEKLVGQGRDDDAFRLLEGIKDGDARISAELGMLAAFLRIEQVPQF